MNFTIESFNATTEAPSSLGSLIGVDDGNTQGVDNWINTTASTITDTSDPPSSQLWQQQQSTPIPSMYTIGQSYNDVSNRLPRFGHTDQFAKLFSDNSEEFWDYVQGVAFIFCIILIVFLVWFVVLLVLKFCACCTTRVGFLSGAPYQAATTAPLPESKQEQPRYYGERRMTWSVLIGRTVFTLAALGFIVFAIVMVTRGVGSFVQTSKAFGFTSEQFAQGTQILIKTKRGLQKLMEIGRQALQRTKRVVSMIKQVLPTQDEIDKPLYRDLYQKAQVVVQFLGQLKDYAQEPATTLTTTVDQALSVMERIYNYFNYVDLQTFTIAAAIPLTVVPFLMVVSMVASSVVEVDGRYSRWLSCCTAWFLLPIFIVMVVLLCFFGALFSVAAVVGSDFCAGGFDRTPTGTLTLIMDYQGLQSSHPRAYQAAEFVMRGCAVPEGEDWFPPLRFLDVLKADLNATANNIESMILDIDIVGVNYIKSELGERFGDEIKLLVTMLRELVASLFNLAENVLEILSVLVCEVLNTIYQHVVYKATCNQSMDALLWTFGSMIAMVFFGLLMLTFRSALYPMTYSNENPEKKGSPHDEEVGVLPVCTNDNIDTVDSPHVREIEQVLDPPSPMLSESILEQQPAAQESPHDSSLVAAIAGEPATVLKEADVQSSSTLRSEENSQLQPTDPPTGTPDSGKPVILPEEASSAVPLQTIQCEVNVESVQPEPAESQDSSDVAPASGRLMRTVQGNYDPQGDGNRHPTEDVFYSCRDSE